MSIEKTVFLSEKHHFFDVFAVLPCPLPFFPVSTALVLVCFTSFRRVFPRRQENRFYRSCVSASKKPATAFKKPGKKSENFLPAAVIFAGHFRNICYNRRVIAAIGKKPTVPVVELDTIKASDADMLSSPNRQRSTIYSVFGFYPFLYLVVPFIRNRNLHPFYTRTDKMLPVRDCMYNPKLYRSSVLNAFLYSKINAILCRRLNKY